MSRNSFLGGAVSVLLFLTMVTAWCLPIEAQDRKEGSPTFVPPPAQNSVEPSPLLPPPPVVPAPGGSDAGSIPALPGAATPPAPSPVLGSDRASLPGADLRPQPATKAAPTLREQFKSENIDGLLGKLKAIKAQQAELDKAEKEAVAVLKEKLKEQRELLKKLGINVEPEGSPPGTADSDRAKPEAFPLIPKG